MKEKIIRRQRDSGVELLRIFAALFVIILHYCNPDIGGAITGSKLAESSINFFVLSVLRSISSCAVDVFVLISGYYLIKNDYRGLGKPFSLVAQIIVMHVVGYLIKTGIHCFRDFSVVSLLTKCLVTNYFVTLYTVLYFLSPLLNKLFINMDKQTFRKVLFVLLFFFSFYPTLWDVIRELTGNEFYGTSTIGNWGSQHGYTIVNFVVLYVIGVYLRLFGVSKFVNDHALTLTIACVLVIFLWGYSPSLLPEGQSSARSYHNPIVILLAVTLFVSSCKLKMRSRIINELAKASYTCFLLHLFIIGHIHAYDFAQGSVLVLCAHLLSSLLFIFILSYIFFKIYDFVFSPLIRLLNQYALSYKSEETLITKHINEG